MSKELVITGAKIAGGGCLMAFIVMRKRIVTALDEKLENESR